MIKTNDVIHGFTVTNIRPMKDCNGTLYEMTHTQSGAHLCWLQRDDDNITFSVAFKTIPENDTGVFHILEHSVLCGSKKYPVKEPFVNLLKSSLQTFLNAMTYPDKTLYPISTRNQKDYMNLMSVYLDAVFHPAIYDNPNIFYQEGWHYEIHNSDEEPTYKGVVFNEMKGAFSSVDEMMVNELNRMLFPDNCYQYVSGGDPVKIPSLSYEQFIATHQKFYHPSNARFFLDGRVDIDQVLQFIDSEYLSHYEKLDVCFDIPMQKETKAATHVFDYEIAEGEDPENKTMAALAKIVSSYDDVEQNTAWQALSTVLVGTNESPFKKAILEQGLGQDVELDLYDGIQQPWAVIMVRNTSEEKAEQALQVLKDTAKKLVEHGLDHEMILDSLNQLQFQYLEKKEPAGIMFASTAENSWLYGGDPAMYLDCGSVYDDLRRKTEEGYFEALLKNFLLDDDHLSAVIANPSTEVGPQRLAKEADTLKQAKQGWGDQVQQYIDLNAGLDQWQASEDSEAQLATLPKLTLADVDPKPVKFVAEETEIGGAEALVYPKENSGIVYLNLYFSLGGITRDHLPSIRLFADLLKELPTDQHNVEQLRSLIRRDLGTLSFSVIIQRSPDDVHACVPLFGVSCSVLESNVMKAKELIVEILKQTVFNADEIRPLLKQNLEAFRQQMIGFGHVFALNRVAAHLTADGAAREYTSGYAYGEYLKALVQDDGPLMREFINDTEMYQKLLFTRTRMTISYTDPSQHAAMEELCRSFELGDAHRCLVHYPLLDTGNEGMSIPAQIAYSAYGADLASVDAEYDGSWQVLGQIMNYGYLWNEVRVKGGAYGTGMSIQPSGTMTCWSYRDPDVSRSLKTYQGCGQYLRESLKEDADLEQYIIGTIAKNEPLLSPGQKITYADMQHFVGLDYERQCGRRTEMLTTEAEDLIHDADLLDQAYEHGVCCVIGSKEKLDSCSDWNLTVHKPL